MIHMWVAVRESGSDENFPMRDLSIITIKTDRYCNLLFRFYLSKAKTIFLYILLVTSKTTERSLKNILLRKNTILHTHYNETGTNTIF